MQQEGRSLRGQLEVQMEEESKLEEECDEDFSVWLAFNEHLQQMKCTGYNVVDKEGTKKDVPDRFAHCQKAQLVGMMR